jgi:hypothetical protein
MVDITCNGSGVALFAPDHYFLKIVSIGVIAAIGIALCNIMSGEHPPDPSSCRPQDLSPFVVTRTISPVTAPTCLNGAPEQRLRWQP